MAQTIIGIMGPGEKATSHDVQNAYRIGAFCAKQGYLVMTGGRPAGVMEAGLKGAKDAGGQTVGILPFKSKDDANPYVDIVVSTGLNSARNYINVLTSDVLVACGVEPGTLSEIALALKENKKVILLTESQKAKDFLVDLCPSLVCVAHTPEQAFDFITEGVK
jgi:uncharacterized protein (TIGR00725 family)